MPVSERFAGNEGLNIRYLDSQPVTPRGLPIVFVPGVTDFADEYTQMMEGLTDRRLLVVEMRGRGGSDRPERGYSAGDQASDVEAVLVANGIERFHVMTFSRGTTPALEVAFRRRGQVASVSIGDYPAAEIALPPNFVDHLWSTTWRGKPMPDRVDRSVLEGIRADAVNRDLSSYLAAMQVPVLVARGSEGGLADEEVVAHFREVIPAVEVVTIPGADHDLFRPSRTAYIEAVVDFISRRAPGT